MPDPVSHTANLKRKSGVLSGLAGLAGSHVAPEARICAGLLSWLLAVRAMNGEFLEAFLLRSALMASYPVHDRHHDIHVIPGRCRYRH